MALLGQKTKGGGRTVTVGQRPGRDRHSLRRSRNHGSEGIGRLKIE